MPARYHLLAALAGALALAGEAIADEAEIMARYGAYSAAFDEGRYPEAAVEAEAAWRAAEAEWGAREETAVLAFNLARLRLLLDQRTEAAEPALRALALVEEGVAGDSIAPEEAVLIAAYARFDAENPSRVEIDALQQALEAYAPSNQTGRRVASHVWFDIVRARGDRRQWSLTYEAAERATLAMQDDAGVQPSLLGAVAAYGARAAYELDELGDALVLAHRGLAAFPPQPPDQPIEPMLGALVGWDHGLHNLLDQRGEPFEATEEYPEPEWDVGRYPTAMGCAVEWIDRPPPRYPSRAASYGVILGMRFEYYLDADGAVIRVDPVGSTEESFGFADAVVAAMRGWRASPQPRAECRGPWAVDIHFQMEN